MGDNTSSRRKLEKEKKTIFLSKENEVYRIPALFYDRDSKVLLAFAEKRRTENDSSALALVMKRGIMNKDEITHEVTSELKPVKEAHIAGYRPMNPCPVYDKTSKTLFLFFICVKGTVSECWQRCSGCNKTRICYVTTTDAGQTWSNATDLTDKLPEIKNWATFAVGPGHGLQAEDVMILVKGGYRVEAVSYNNGEDFSTLPSAGKLAETGSGCQGSVVFFPAQDANIYPNLNRERWLLYTHPTDQSKRIHLGVYLNKSPHDPNAWSRPWIINSGPSAYSDLAYIDDGWFACLMECGQVKGTEQIAFTVFSYSEVKQGIGE